MVDLLDPSNVITRMFNAKKYDEMMQQRRQAYKKEMQARRDKYEEAIKAYKEKRAKIAEAQKAIYQQYEQDRADLSQGPTLSTPKRYIQEIASLCALDLDNPGRAGSIAARRIDRDL